jgi:BarA-like signal transduction histidine kinase
MISRGSALDERRGPHDDSREILVKTPGNNSSLRLNAKPRKHHELMLWEVTLPFKEPLQLVKENGKWISFGKSKAAISLIVAIGNAIDEQLGY